VALQIGNYNDLDIDAIRQKTFLAVGFPIGMILNNDGSDMFTGKEPVYWVRFGGRLKALDRPGTHVWLQCMAPKKGAEVEKFLLDNGIVETMEDCASEMLDLLKNKLIVPFDEGSFDSLFDLYVYSQGTGLGNDLEDPSHYSIGELDGKLSASVDFIGFIFWTLCDGSRTLREIIHATSQTLNIDESVFSNQLYSWLMCFAMARVIYFDAPREER
jgi:hypothetical protein